MFEKQELFKSKDWLGVFFAPGDFVNRFPGNLKYSPKGGVMLSYMVPCDKKISPTEVLHAVLNDGRKCTLLGGFDMNFAGSTRVGDQDSQTGEHGFTFARMGGHHQATSPISEVIFSLTGLDEFFFRTGFKGDLKFSQHAEFTMKLRFGTLAASHDAFFNHVGKDIRTLFHCLNSDVLDDLQKTCSNFLERDKHSILMLKKDISYRLHLKFSDDIDINEAYQHILSISRLFALLLNKPCHAERVTVVENDTNGDRGYHHLYPAHSLSDETISLIAQRVDHVTMPINRKRVDLEKLIHAWMESDGRFDDLISPIQNDTGRTTHHAMKGNILLYSSQLESIAHAHGVTQEKYEGAVRRYSEYQMQELLQNLFSVESLEELGVAIGDLRNDIAHIGRPKKFLNSLSGDAMHRISLCLELIVLGYVLNQIGVAEKTWKYYQIYFLPKW